MVKDDKFIMMNMDDERSKEIASVLGNKTAKRILNYLADNHEQSEEDISKSLNMPINTVEYNLKKLLKTGLVEKAKKFFWSKRGKKIDLYKVAKKHIVISPRKSKPSMVALKAVLPVIVAIAIIAAIALMMIPTEGPVIVGTDGLKYFSSSAELQSFLEENSQQDNRMLKGGFGGAEIAIEPAMAADSSAGVTASGASESKSQSASDFSTTNIQIEGVDEPDIVKNDDKYIYVVSGSKVIIINAYPAEDMEILTELVFDGYVSNIFISEDKLIVYMNDYSRKGSEVNVLLYDTSNPKNPTLENEYTLDGSYRDARMIGDYVYTISTKYANTDMPELPMYKVNGVKTEIFATDVAYIDSYDTRYTFTSISAINVENGNFNAEVYLTGASHNIFVSENNIYLTYLKQMPMDDFYEGYIDEVVLKVLPNKEANKVKDILESSNLKEYQYMREISEFIEDYSFSLKGKDKADFDQELMETSEQYTIAYYKDSEKTIIHKIQIDNGDIEYKEIGEVPGRVLNQFSMDEHNGYLRIATTTGNSWRFRQESLNHMYVLNQKLDIVGSIEDLAEGERIYSARFMGDRAYMVTFRQVDPLYVIDLSNPKNPEVLGFLKVTGFSSYLHPYDENHIIGIGREATDQGRAQGIKIALFDVSDVENPKEVSKYEVPGRSSGSNALYDHKAFLFDKEKELLVLPMSYEEELASCLSLDCTGPTYKYVQGAMVFQINLEDGIKLRDTVVHQSNSDNRYYYNSQYAVKRSLFMDDILYTISRAFVKANDLGSISLKEINSIEFPIDDDPIIYYESEVVTGSGGPTEVVVADVSVAI